MAVAEADPRARCTCVLEEAAAPTTLPRDCRKHQTPSGPARTRPGAPLPRPAGVPLVDLTALLADTYQRADAHRAAARNLDQIAEEQRRTADHLEALAAALSGGNRGE